MTEKFVYKGVLCRAGTFRINGEDRPALFYIDAPDQKTLLEAGFDEIRYGLWAKILTEDEYEEILSRT